MFIFFCFTFRQKVKNKGNNLKNNGILSEEIMKVIFLAASPQRWEIEQTLPPMPTCLQLSQDILFQ
jgi:hypothetical protein